MNQFDQLPKYLQDKCEQAALGQVFTDYDAVPYAAIVDWLSNSQDVWDVYKNNSRITIWEVYERLSAIDVLDILEQLKRDFAWVAQTALDGNLEKEGTND